MRKEYDFSKTQKNPYTKDLKKQVTMRGLTKIQLVTSKIFQRIKGFIIKRKLICIYVITNKHIKNRIQDVPLVWTGEMKNIKTPRLYILLE